MTTSDAVRRWTATIWKGMELAAIEDFDNLISAVIWTRKQIADETRAGYVDVTAAIAPEDKEL